MIIPPSSSSLSLYGSPHKSNTQGWQFYFLFFYFTQGVRPTAINNESRSIEHGIKGRSHPVSSPSIEHALCLDSIKGKKRVEKRNNIPHTQEFWLNPLTVIHRQPKRDEKAFILSTLFFIFVGRALWGFVIVCAGANRPSSGNEACSRDDIDPPSPLPLPSYYITISWL